MPNYEKHDFKSLSNIFYFYGATMQITTVSKLEMTEIKNLIAGILNLPESNIFDEDSVPDVSSLDRFVTVLNISQTEIGKEILYFGNEEEEVISTLKEATITVKTYGNDAYDLLCKLTESMKLTPVWQKLKKLRMGYLRCSDIENISTTSADETIRHAQVDLIFSINPIVKTEIKRGDNVNFIFEVTK